MLHVTPTAVKNVTLAYIGEEPETQMQPKKGAIGKKSEPFYKMAKRLCRDSGHSPKIWS